MRSGEYAISARTYLDAQTTSPKVLWALCFSYPVTATRA